MSLTLSHLERHLIKAAAHARCAGTEACQVRGIDLFTGRVRVSPLLASSPP